MTTTPALAHTREELAAALARRPRPLALVPTMGALHEGHASLMRLAREGAGAEGTLAVSIFVNPLQFGPDEDFDRYPRDLDADLAVCERQGVDVVFAPSVEEMYPGGLGESMVGIDPGGLADVLEGASRPGHFRGVLTVVAKLFGLFRPELAVFGEKDYQQLALIRRMVGDLELGVDVLGAPTDRDPDGLARSSRNAYLSADERSLALALSAALFAAREAAGDGPEAARTAAQTVLDKADGLALDYLEVRGADLGELPSDVPPATPGRALVAARVGSTRLIDNLDLLFGPSEGSN